jgi:hypothetical protein
MNSKRLVSAVAFALVTAGSSGYATATERERDSDHHSDHRHPIVGMWLTTFYVGPFYGPGTPVSDETIQQFSSDGNELISSGSFAPVVGNVCFGVWKALGDNTFKLRHIGWTYNNNAFEGTARLNSTMKVSANGDSYSGTYTTDVILPDGSVLPGSAVEGDVRATRFKVDEASAVHAQATWEKAPASARLPRRPGC